MVFAVSAEVLRALPVLLRWVPAIVNVIAEALGGGEHIDEGAWCAHVPELADVCRALRAQEVDTSWVVRNILRDVKPQALAVATEQLRLRMMQS